MSDLLSKINSPEELRALPEFLIPALCREVRRFLVENVTRSGGHLASNLGVVELTLALHRVFESPRDRIIWDVGHQSYVHKLVTGRREQFPTLRAEGGLSGFTKRSESPHDPFGAGHSSTAMSAAVGFAEADRLSGADRWTIAVVGDGAFTGGMCYEALNNVRPDLRLIIVLNENEMSISKNVGSVSRYISAIRSTRCYFDFKRVVEDTLARLPVVGEDAVRAARRVKNAMKAIVYDSADLFECFGLTYLGPADGNDYDKAELLLRQAKARGGASLVHLKTVKGYGWRPARTDPTGFHSCPARRRAAATGDADAPAGGVFGEATVKAPGGAARVTALPRLSPSPLTFSAAFAGALVREADRDPRVCAVTAAMEEGTGLSLFHRQYPGRFFDVGIAEAHAVTFSAGLSAAGMKPVFAVYSSFLQRACDSLLHDVGVQKLPLALGVDRAGLSPDDGVTHHGIYDLPLVSAVEGAEVYAPASPRSVPAMLRAALSSGRLSAVRYPKGGDSPDILEAFFRSEDDFGEIKIRSTPGGCKNKKVVLVTYGRLASECLRAAALLPPGEAGVLLLERLAPVSDVLAELLPLLPDAPADVVFAEEAARRGSLGEAVAASVPRRLRFIHAAIDFPPEQAPLSAQLAECGLDAASLAGLAASCRAGAENPPTQSPENYLDRTVGG